MVIDFEKIEEVTIEGFRGGKGELHARNYMDDKCKIMRHVLKPGASSGLHSHEENCEIIYVLDGVATCHYDGNVEEVYPGQVHYCPMGHSHFMVNNGEKDLLYFAVVPEHH